jgi:RNA polymerase sigma factor (sigma-70 family)
MDSPCPGKTKSLNESQQEIVQRFTPMIHKEVVSALRRFPLLNYEDTESEAIDSAIRVAKWYRPENGAPLAPLMAKCIRRAIGQLIAKQIKRQKPKCMSFQDNEPLINQVVHEEDPSHRLQISESYSSALRILTKICAGNKMPQRDIAIFVAYVRGDMTIRQISSDLGITIQDVKNTVTRVKKKIREMYP